MRANGADHMPKESKKERPCHPMVMRLTIDADAASIQFLRVKTTLHTVCEGRISQAIRNKIPYSNPPQQKLNAQTTHQF
jgi:hypothetical protein